MSFRLLSPFAFLLAVSAPISVNAQQIGPPGIKVTLATDNAILACKPSRTVAPECVIKPLPAKVGKVSQLIQGNFLPNFRVNWIAVGKQKLSLCALPTKQGAVLCNTISNEWDNSKFGVAFAAGKFYFVPKTDSRETPEEIAKHFSAGLSKAAKKLGPRVEAKLANPQIGDLLGPMLAADEEDEEIRPYDPWDEGGGGGGGFGDAGDGCVFAGPILVCRSTPPPPHVDPSEPVDPPTVGEPWYCTYLGLFCSAPPELPEPLPPIPQTPNPVEPKPVEPKPVEPEETAAERWDRIASQCRADCEWTLPTPPGNDGWNWQICFDDCMRENGLYP